MQEAYRPTCSKYTLCNSGWGYPQSWDLAWIGGVPQSGRLEVPPIRTDGNTPLVRQMGYPPISQMAVPPSARWGTPCQPDGVPFRRLDKGTPGYLPSRTRAAKNARKRKCMVKKDDSFLPWRSQFGRHS